MSHARTATIVVALLALGCPGDDGGSDSGDDSPGSTSSATGSTETSGDPGTDTSGDPTTPGSTSAADSSSTAGPADSTGSDGSTGGGLDGVVLQNDSWTPADAIEFQTWPNMQDCWASVFTADAGDYPFDIVGARAAIGGGGDGVVTLTAAVYSVDNQGTPDTELASTTFMVDSATTDLTEVDLSGLGLDPIDGGDFAIVMCHTRHMGAPTIAIDVDGSVDADRNWVFQQAMGEWVSSPDFFGIDGDFILRAVIAPQG